MKIIIYENTSFETNVTIAKKSSQLVTFSKTNKKRFSTM